MLRGKYVLCSKTLHRKTNIAQNNLQLTHKTRVYHSMPSAFFFLPIDFMDGATPRVRNIVGQTCHMIRITRIRYGFFFLSDMAVLHFDTDFN